MFGKALLMGGMLAVSAGLAADEAVKLENPGFESGITGWRLHGSQPKDAAARIQVLTIVPGEKPGTKALKLQDIWSDCNPYAMQHVVTRMPGEDMVLEMRFRAFAKSGQRFQAKAEMQEADPANPGKFKGFTGTSSVFTGTGKWEGYVLPIERLPWKNFKIGVGFVAYIYSRDFTLTGEVLIDDVELVWKKVDFAGKMDLNRVAGNRVEYPHSPAEGAVWTVNPGSFTFLSPRDWVPGKYTYTLEYSQDKAFQNDSTVRVTGLDMHMYIPDKTLAPGKWFWRYGVERKNLSPVWSKVRSFTVPAGVRELPFPDLDEAIKRIPKGHPRIYFTPESARELRRRGLQGDLAAMTRLRKESQSKWLQKNDIPDGEPPFLPSRAEVGMAKWLDAWRNVISITHGRLNRMESLALTYLLSGDEKYGKAAAEYVKYFFSLNPDGSTAMAHNDEPGMWIMRRGIMSYDWTHEFYTPEEHKMIRKNLKLRAQRVYEILRKQNFDCRPFGSHQANGYQAILLEASIFLAPDDPDPEIRKWMRYSLTTFRTSWPPFGTPDGGWSEGPAYWSWSIDRGLRMITILKNSLGVDLTFLDFIKNTGYYILQGWPGKSKLYSGCDSFAPESQASALYMLAMTLNNPDFLQPARTIGIDPLKTSWASVLMVLADAKSMGEPALDKLPKARLFPGIGFVTMRKTLTGCEDDIGMLFQSCPAGNHSHRLNSQNNIQFEAYGERMFFSGGHYDAQGSPHYRDWTVESRSHNCVTFDDGQGQARGGFANGSIVHFADKGNLAVATGDASAAYPALKSVLRTVVHLRQDNDVFLVRDRCVSAAARTFEFNLHTDTEAEYAMNPDGLEIRKPLAGCRVVLLDKKPWADKDWTGFRVNPSNRKQFPDRRHFRFSAPEKSQTMDLISVFLPFRSGKAGDLPQVRRDGDTVTLTWPDGSVKKVRFSGNDAELVK